MGSIDAATTEMIRAGVWSISPFFLWKLTPFPNICILLRRSVFKLSESEGGQTLHSKAPFTFLIFPTTRYYLFNSVLHVITNRKKSNSVLE